MREKSLRQDKHAKLGKRYKQKKFISSCCNQGVNIGNVPRNSFIVCSGMMELPLNCLYIFFLIILLSALSYFFHFSYG